MRRLRRRGGVVVALLGVAAVLAPTATAADAPVPLPDPTALVDATLAATDPAAVPDADAVLEVVEEAATVAQAAVVPHTTAPTAPAQPQPAPPEPAPAPAVTAPAPAPEAPRQTAKASGPAPEAPSQAPQATPSPTAQADVQQTQPVNLNVTIRVESPGDNGPVSQVNAAVGAVAAELATNSAAGPPQPAAEQPSPEAPSETAAPVAPESPTTISASTGAAAERWDWTWNLDCGGVISPDIVLPGTSSLPIWNWNWNWNCGADPAAAEKIGTEKPTQYHGTTAQYQPVNVNISIRVASPGNDGAVTQRNVAQTIVSVIAAATQPLLPGGTGPPARPSAPAPQHQAPAAAPVESLASVIVELATEVAALPLELVVELGCCEAPLPFAEPAGDDGALGGRVEGATAVPAADGPKLRPRPSGPDVGDITVVAGAIAGDFAVPPEVAALVVPKPRAEAARRAATQERLTKPFKHRAAPAMERAAVLSYGGITPLGAPDRTPKLFLLFLLPFVFGLVAAARRVEDDDRAAAAEPGRPEGRPG